MAWDLSRTPTTGVNVQACGDAHCYNLGLYASPERRAVFDINDFDETLPGPWEWDLKRLAVSVLLDACAHGHSEETGLDLLRITLRRYCDELEELSHATSLDIHYAHVESDELIARTDDPRVADEMRARVAKARRRTNHQAFRKWAHVVDGELRFVEEPPLLVRLPDEMIERFHALLNRYRSTLQPNRRHLLEQYRFRDAARKVVGVARKPIVSESEVSASRSGLPPNRPLYWSAGFNATEP